MKPERIQHTMRSRLRVPIAAVLTLSVFSNTCFAEMKDPLGLNKEQLNQGGASEFVFRNDPEEILVPVYVLGAVQRPGLYHIPVRTDLITLMALTGGPTQAAETDDILVKKQVSKEVLNVDLEKLVAGSSLKTPVLNNNDVVLVKTKEPIVSSNTMLVLTLVTTVLSAGLAALAVSKAK
jgi:hypothetical protein